MDQKENLSYSRWLLIVLFAITLIYIGIESFYNYNVLTVTTDSTLSREQLEALNLRGHLIASMGITLIVFPLIYKIAKLFRSTFFYFHLLLLIVIRTSLRSYETNMLKY